MFIIMRNCLRYLLTFKNLQGDVSKKSEKNNTIINHNFLVKKVVKFVDFLVFIVLMSFEWSHKSRYLQFVVNVCTFFVDKHTKLFLE